MCKKGCAPAMVIKALVKIGALNWGLIGVGYFFGKDWNVVDLIFGNAPAVENIIYILVGLAAIMMCFHCKCKKCKGGSCGTDKKEGGCCGGH